MGCHGGFSLDDSTRRSWYNPEFILKNLRLGMVFLDVGCGDGFFSILAAKKVGEKGRVYAVDIDSSAIAKLKDKAVNAGLKNIVAKVNTAEDTIFCKKCVDFVLFSMNLHDFSEPLVVLKNARKMIKSNGSLVDLDWKKTGMSFGPPNVIRFSEEKAAGLIQSAGFTLVDVMDVGPYHYMVTAKP